MAGIATDGTTLAYVGDTGEDHHCDWQEVDPISGDLRYIHPPAQAAVGDRVELVLSKLRRTKPVAGRPYKSDAEEPINPDAYEAIALINQIVADLAERDGRVERLLGALSWIDKPFVDAATPEKELRDRISFALADRDKASALLSGGGGQFKPTDK